LHLPTIVLNTLMIALVLATVPLEQVLGGANVLSVLAQIVSCFLCFLFFYTFHSFHDLALFVLAFPFSFSSAFVPLLMFTLMLTKHTQSAGPWLRKWIVVDAAVVLCGGVLTGEQTLPRATRVRVLVEA
jgi:hypothetical protein